VAGASSTVLGTHSDFLEALPIIGVGVGAFFSLFTFVPTRVASPNMESKREIPFSAHV